MIEVPDLFLALKKQKELDHLGNRTNGLAMWMGLRMQFVVLIPFSLFGV